MKIFTGLESIFLPESEGVKGEVLTSRMYLLQVKSKPNNTFYDPWVWLSGYELRSNIIHSAHDYSDYFLQIDDKSMNILENQSKDILELACRVIRKTILLDLMN
ncbi:MAG: hypothetical protein ACTSPV_15220 [Candidatus Hodarchaeales archaeon]